MRRRRRPPTRIVKRANSFDPNIAFQQNKGESNSKNYLKIIIVIAAIALVSYFAYNNWYLPEEISQTVTLDTIENETENQDNENISENTFEQPEKMIQIEVLNGCGESGIAKIFESYLRQQGFDVVNTENYRIMGKINWNVPNSKVIDQIGKLENAQRVAESLGIEDKYVFSNDNPSPVYDVSVVIGKDYKNIKGFKEFSK